MIGLPVSFLWIMTLALATLLPDLKEYVTTRVEHDRACQRKAESLVERFHQIDLGNVTLAQLRLQCPAAALNPLALAAITTASDLVVVEQSLVAALITTETVQLTGTGYAVSVVSLNRQLPGRCGIAGDIALPCSPRDLIRGANHLAGFAVACDNSLTSTGSLFPKHITWTFRHPDPREIL